MKYTSSSEPLYTVVMERLTKDEHQEFTNWALNNITGQMIYMTSGGNYFTVKSASKPENVMDHFGRPYGFSEQTISAASVIGFTHQEDLTAFLIVFESKVD